MTGCPDGLEWVPLARKLADVLAERGALHDPAWLDAVLAVPRHELVLKFYTQDRDASWRTVTGDDPDYLSSVYANRPLVTDLCGGEPASSSSQPSLMIRMLETLRIAEGHRVLEIGTGTGYNAALMAHRIGERNVFSVDIDAALVDLARERLARIGYRPALAALDGARGWPDHAPYDKIIATCSVRTVPWDWARQLPVGGELLVDVKVGVKAGNLVLLRRHEDRMEGRFVPGSASFMSIRHPDNGGGKPVRGPSYEDGVRRVTTVEPEPWRNPVSWFVAAFAQPPGLGYGVTLDPTTGRPSATFLTAPDGSWCQVEHERCGDGYELVEYGPTALWSHAEDADRWWRDAGCPGWERLGLTATADEQWVWLDEPESRCRWVLG